MRQLVLAGSCRAENDCARAPGIGLTLTRTERLELEWTRSGVVATRRPVGSISERASLGNMYAWGLTFKRLEPLSWLAL